MKSGSPGRGNRIGGVVGNSGVGAGLVGVAGGRVPVPGDVLAGGGTIVGGRVTFPGEVGGGVAPGPDPVGPAPPGFIGATPLRPGFNRPTSTAWLLGGAAERTVWLMICFC